MRRIARRLYGHICTVEASRQASVRNKSVQRMVDMRCIFIKKGHDFALKLTRITA